MEQINFDDMLAKIDRKQAELEGIGRQLATISATARSSDGLVEVTVNAAGTVRSVRLAPETFRRSNPRHLGHSVIEAIQTAAHQVGPHRKHIVAPIIATGRAFADSAAEPNSVPPKSTPASSATEIEASSTDRTVRVALTLVGTVTAVDISPDAFRSNTTTHLATAITDAAQRATRQLYESRTDALDPELRQASDATETAGPNALFPIPTATAASAPTTQPALPNTPTSAPHQPTPKPRHPRDQIVGPSDWSDFDEYGEPPKSWLV
ncbi:YbaB/EbfC family nucleoid-associated protein [Nocardia sp. NPDC051321]|uniref:YbaB/EbfC family nucleoid-associated protein n=1 Tax=Nocardia sp. NPDC051321 TaxID=3364323 RepID=UPI00379FD4AC